MKYYLIYIMFFFRQGVDRPCCHRMSRNIRSHLKKVFSSDIVVEPSCQVLDILEYACVSILAGAAGFV
jgi:hypothetical protein